MYLGLSRIGTCGYYTAFLMVTLLYVNFLKFIIPPAVAHEATSSVCHFSFFHIRTAFVIGNYLLHTHYILMQTLFFSAAQGRGGTVNIPPF